MHDYIKFHLWSSDKGSEAHASWNEDLKLSTGTGKEFSKQQHETHTLLGPKRENQAGNNKLLCCRQGAQGFYGNENKDYHSWDPLNLGEWLKIEMKK